MKPVQYNGELFYLPDDAKDGEIKSFINKYDLQKAQKAQGPPAGQPPVNPILKRENNHFGGEPSQGNAGPPEEFPRLLPAVGASVRSLADRASTIPGAALGSIAKQLLERKEQTAGEAAGDIATDVGANALLPAAVSKIPFIGKLVGKMAERDNPAIQDYIQKGAERFTNYPESSLIETAASNARGSGL